MHLVFPSIHFLPDRRDNEITPLLPLAGLIQLVENRLDVRPTLSS